jgi:hypothetical protein
MAKADVTFSTETPFTMTMRSPVLRERTDLREEASWPHTLLVPTDLQHLQVYKACF